MKKEIAELVVGRMREETEDVSIYKDYSGRGMYSKTTTGISFEGDIPEFFNLMIRVLIQFDEEDMEIMSEMDDFRFDNLGLGSIIY